MIGRSEDKEASDDSEINDSGSSNESRINVTFLHETSARKTYADATDVKCLVSVRQRGNLFSARIGCWNVRICKY